MGRWALAIQVSSTLFENQTPAINSVAEVEPMAAAFPLACQAIACLPLGSNVPTLRSITVEPAGINWPSAASALANHRIARHCPDCVIIQNESAEFTHQGFAVESPEITLWNKLRFLPLDLLYVHSPDAEVCSFLFNNGMRREEYQWKMRGEPQ